jgi:hypothetical protein
MDDLDDDDKLDLTALDPARDALRWERTLRATVDRAVAVRRVPPLVRELAAMRRPALLCAAAAALLVWSATLVAPRPGRTGGAAGGAGTDETGTLLDWAQSNEAPSASDILETLGGGHGQR